VPRSDVSVARVMPSPRDIGSRLQPVALQLQHHVCVSSNGAGPATRSFSCTVGKWLGSDTFRLTRLREPNRPSGGAVRVHGGGGRGVAAGGPA
jgi:hypothetical protein